MVPLDRWAISKANRYALIAGLEKSQGTNIFFIVVNFILKISVVLLPSAFINTSKVPGGVAIGIEHHHRKT
jgi:hypothetical protein